MWHDGHGHHFPSASGVIADAQCANRRLGGSGGVGGGGGGGGGGLPSEATKSVPQAPHRSGTHPPVVWEMSATARHVGHTELREPSGPTSSGESNSEP